MTATYRGGQSIQEGDTVAVMLHTYRNGEVTGSRVAVKGRVTRIYQRGTGGHWRAQVIWEDDVKGFMYTGNTNWAYVRNLTLIKRHRHA